MLSELLLFTLFQAFVFAHPSKQPGHALFHRAATPSVVTQTVTVTVSGPTQTVTVSACSSSPSTTVRTTSSTSSRLTTSTTVSTTTRPTTTTTRPSTTTSKTTTTSSIAPANTDGVIKQGCNWNVPGTGLFRNRAAYTFTSNSLPDGLLASDYTINDRANNPSIPYNHLYTPSNVVVSGGYLNLIVPGGQKPSASKPISCAEVATNFKMLYGSVRIKAQFSKVKGTCQGAFLYKNDSQEVDIEYLSDPASQSNNGPNNPIPFWYSNQAIVSGGDATQSSIDPPSDPTTAVREYRIDWMPSYTAFFVDGVEQTRYFDNIPTDAMYWIMNNWSNGDQGWSVGPPLTDNVMKIQSITMYYNSTTPPAPGSC